MKRSEINAILKRNMAFLKQMNFALPQFAFWSPAEWGKRGAEVGEIVERRLGWDITDFGGGDYNRVGLFLFTVRNGPPDAFQRKGAKTYAEKIMIVKESQVTPTHFHHVKMEDIINRGGGELMVQVWNATADDRLDTTPVTTGIDGVARTVNAGTTLALKPGDSICLPPRMYHSFWGRPGFGRVLVGEVSMVNDDEKDNRFIDPVGRFPAIEEDEPPILPLCTEYSKWWRGATAAGK